MKKYEKIISVSLLLILIFTSFTSFSAKVDDLQENVLRIHILANSNSDDDQALKIAVRDAVLEYSADLYVGAVTKEDILEISEDNLVNFYDAAVDTIKSYGYDYTVQIGITNIYFEDRVYDSIIMPKGYYDALQIIIGEGEGENWWCVMYPNICFSTATDIEEEFDEETADILTNNGEYTVKFAVVDAVKSVVNWITG